MKIPVSFKEEEIDIYKYIKSKRNFSVYIKDLVEADMKKDGIVIKAKLAEQPKVNKSEAMLEVDF